MTQLTHSPAEEIVILRIPVGAEAFRNWLTAYVSDHQAPILTDAGRFQAFRATWPRDGVPIRAAVLATWYATDGSDLRGCELVVIDVIPLGEANCKIEVRATMSNGAQYARDMAEEARRDWEIAGASEPAGRESGHFQFPAGRRRAIVDHYRADRREGKVENKEAWAGRHYQISARTLSNYEREFPSEP